MTNIKDNINILDHLATLDWIVFFSILLVTVFAIYYGQTLKNKSSSDNDSFIDLMLMGRQLTLPMFIATLVATWYGGIFGVAQIAFNNGIYNFVTQGFFWYASYIIFAIFILKRLKNYDSITLPELVEKMYGPKSGKLTALLNIINLLPIAYSISIGILIQMLFGFSYSVSVTLGVFFVVSYSFIGGFRAVVFSDIVQFFIMFLTVILILYFSISTYGTEKLLELPDSYFNPLGTYGILETLSWGLIAISTLVDPNFYQRAYAAKDFKVARNGIFISTILWIIFDLSLTFGAMYAKALIPNAESTQAYLIYAIQLLPEGLRGFTIAGIFATVLSTLDSYIFLASSTFSFDLVPKRYKAQISIHHFSTILFGIISIILALVFEGDIKNVWKTLGSLSTSALLIPILYGLCKPSNLTDKSFLFCSTFGIISCIYWRFSGLKEKYNLDEIYIGSLFSLMGIVIVSLLPRRN
jgi:SSS family solute:Na+ symporter